MEALCGSEYYKGSYTKMGLQIGLRLAEKIVQYRLNIGAKGRVASLKVCFFAGAYEGGGAYEEILSFSYRQLLTLLKIHFSIMCEIM